MESTRRVIRDAYDRKIVIAKNDEPSLTQQQFKDECDINNIIKRFDQTGIITHVNSMQPRYGEATAQSFTEAMYLVTEATDNFMQLPAAIRSEFDNDPATYLDALVDPEQQAKLQEMGLLPGFENTRSEDLSQPDATMTNDPPSDSAVAESPTSDS